MWFSKRKEEIKEEKKEDNKTIKVILESLELLNHQIKLIQLDIDVLQARSKKRILNKKEEEEDLEEDDRYGIPKGLLK